MAKAIHSIAQLTRKPKAKAPPMAALPMAGGSVPSVAPTDIYVPPSFRRSRSMDPKLRDSSSPRMEDSDSGTYTRHRNNSCHGKYRVAPPSLISEGVPMDFWQIT